MATFSASDGIFDNVYHVDPIVEYELPPIFHIIFVEMANDFKTCFKRIYRENKQWKRILNFVNPQNEIIITDEKPPTLKNLRFRYKNGFVYYINEFNGKKRLYIPKTLKKIVHEEQNYGGFNKIYDKITISIYMRKFNRHFQ